MALLRLQSSHHRLPAARARLSGCARLRWVLVVLASGIASGAGNDLSKEDRIKAAFLFNFTKFVEWPADRFAYPGSQIVLGVVGANPVSAELVSVVRDRQAHGRSLVVRSITSPAEARAVHLLFVPAGEEAVLGELDEVLKGAAVLTVGETERFAAKGGMITFTREADKIRFVINLESAERAGLKLSAQLLKLTTAVRRKNKT